MPISFSIYLRKHVLRYPIGLKQRFVLVLIIYDVHYCIHDWIIVVYTDWHPILVPQTLCNLRKVRPVYISWYWQIHVQINAVKHIWHEIGISLQYIWVVDDVIKLLLKVQVVFRVLGPVLRILFWPVISQVLFLFEATTYLCVKLINNCLDFFCILLYTSDALDCSYWYHCYLLGQYSIWHEYTIPVGYSKPPSDSFHTKYIILLVVYMVI